ncbi:MAG: zf-HC2 domain-containing protein [Candidatus Sulfotelmatobacter sp.]
MDHTAVVRQKMTERYLLDELDSEVRDEFEEHYFGCPECALDIRAGAQFVTHTKTVLAKSAEPTPVRATPGPRPVVRGWFAWLRPAFAAPALALLLAVVGYQNLVTYPRFQSELNQPQVLPAVSVNVGTWGAGGPPTPVPEGKGLLLFVRIPPDGAYVRYTADLYSPGGKLEGSFTIAPAAGQDQWPVTVPALRRGAGTYTMAVHGINASGEKKDLGTTSFELQIQR